MSCACEHKKLSSEYERMRRLAKATACMNECTVALYRNEDGTYGISTDEKPDKEIVEYITQY